MDMTKNINKQSLKLSSKFMKRSHLQWVGAHLICGVSMAMAGSTGFGLNGRAATFTEIKNFNPLGVRWSNRVLQWAFRMVTLLAVVFNGAISLKAYDFKQGNLFFTVTDATLLTCAVVNGDEAYTGDIIIPSTVSFKNRELKVTSIGNTFSGSDITSIRLSSNIQKIDYFAFYGCTLLTKVIISSSVNKIGEYAFDKCYSLRQLIFEDGLSELEFDNAFDYEYEPFFLDSPLEEIYIGRNITPHYVKKRVFGDLSNLYKVTIGKSVTTIPSFCFADASMLSNISIPGNVECIGSGAFDNCTGLKYIEFQDSPNPIEIFHSSYGSYNSIFSQSPVKEVYIGRNFSDNDSYYYSDDITLEFLPITKVTIGNLVTDLTSLNGCRDLTSISIPSNVKTIQSFDFGHGLRKVIVDSNIPPKAIKFAEETYVHGVLYVPKESIGAYSDSTPWSSFWDIRDISNAGIEDVKCNDIEPAIIGPLYSISGIVLLKHCTTDDLTNLPNGIYIWRGQIIRLNN